LSLDEFKNLGATETIYAFECGHVFTTSFLDTYVAKVVEAREVKPVVCPACRTPVQVAGRYANAIRAQHRLIDAVKRKVAEEREVLRGMGNPSGTSRHWYACSRGHPYFIDGCGGAVEESVCVECRAPIGGRDHELRRDNRSIDLQQT
jgi:hypothetical protein